PAPRPPAKRRPLRARATPAALPIRAGNEAPPTRSRKPPALRPGPPHRGRALARRQRTWTRACFPGSQTPSTPLPPEAARPAGFAGGSSPSRPLRDRVHALRQRHGDLDAAGKALDLRGGGHAQGVELAHGV